MRMSSTTTEAGREGRLSYDLFWKWFVQHEQQFAQAVRTRNGIEAVFFNPLSEKLAAIKPGFFFLAGMPDEQTVELNLTPDGDLCNIVFTEELAAAAPAIPGWKISALKPAMGSDIRINMDGHAFHKDNMHFYFTNDPERPDNIDITIVHNDYSDACRAPITNGCYIFLDNFLGELNFVNQIDNLYIRGKQGLPGGTELVPLDKLPAYLLWREKEFIEKYEGTRQVTEEDTYTLLQAEFDDGNKLIAVINTRLLAWDSKASHPWILQVEIGYPGEHNGGMPDPETAAHLEDIEEQLLAALRDEDGYLNIGRQTATNTREIYMACRDFRKPPKVMQALLDAYTGKLEITYSLYKDKYWKSFDRFLRR